MYKKFLSIAATLAVLGGVAHAQLQRRAVMTGGGNGDRGKCTVEVVVDGAAEVEIRGDEGTLRNLSGQQPQFRRFQCTGLMPLNPANFRFSGIDGRGHQELVRDPRNGGVAVIRIEDTGGGAEGYTFDLTWSGGEPSRGIQDSGPSSYPGGQVPARQYPGEQDRNRPVQDRPVQDRPQQDRFEQRDREVNRQFNGDRAIRVCQDAVRNEAADRFHARNVDFGRTGIDDNPGRRDRVMGSFTVRRGYNGVRNFRFSCSLDLETGRVRSTDIQPSQDRR